MTEPIEMDRHTIQTVQRAVKRKARKVVRPVSVNGERVLYCTRCLKSNYEVEAMIHDRFFNLCDECLRNLAIFMEHFLEKRRTES